MGSLTRQLCCRSQSWSLNSTVCSSPWSGGHRGSWRRSKPTGSKCTGTTPLTARRREAQPHGLLSFRSRLLARTRSSLCPKRGDQPAFPELRPVAEAISRAPSSCRRRIRGPWFEAGSGDSHDAGYLSPGLERPSVDTAMISGLGVGRAAEEVCYLIVNREKALGLTG